MNKVKLSAALRVISDENDRAKWCPEYGVADDIRRKARFPGNVPDDELSAALVAAVVWERHARGARATNLYLFVVHGVRVYDYKRKEHREARQVVRALCEELASRVEGRADSLRRMRAALRAAAR